MIPYQLLRDNTRNIAVVHAYTRKRTRNDCYTKKGKKGQKGAKRGKRGQKSKAKKGKKNETKTSCMRARRRASPEGID